MEKYSLYKQRFNVKDKTFHANYKEKVNGITQTYYDNIEEDIEDIINLKNRFDIFGLKKMTSIPHIIKPTIYTYLQIYLAESDRKYNVNINIGKYEGALYISICK